MTVFACDLESTGLLDDFPNQANPKIHCFGLIDVDTGQEWCLSGEGMQQKLQSFLSRGHTLIMHNGIQYDGEVLKYFGYDLGATKIVDTLPLSQYLYPDRQKHGLDGWGEDLGIKKPKVDDWESLTQDEYDYRVMQDCRIQLALWNKQKALLEKIYKSKDVFDLPIMELLSWKTEQLRLQQQYRWKVDVEKTETLLKQLELEREVKFAALKCGMPKQPIYAKRTRPAKPFKKDGSLSSTGAAWKLLCEQHKVDFDSDETILVKTGEDDPNPASPSQIKAWLDSLGWKPTTFKYIKGEDGEEGRNVPQVNIAGGEVCPSVAALAEKDPAISYLAGLGIIKHRAGMVKGFLRDQKNGEVIARSGGLTNTLRCQHREVVNLPSSRVPYGEDVRGCLIARDGYVLLGSDLSSLENRIAHHFMIKFDPDYVSTMMADDYDPHLQVALLAGLITQDDIQFYKDVDSGRLVDYDKARMKKIKGMRAAGKQTNYACVYGAGAATIARAAGVSQSLAKTLHTGYWELNWSVKKIASLTQTQLIDGGIWQYNPISKIWYSLRADKDRFSTLIQGSGAFTFDRWLWWCQKHFNDAGMEFRLIATFHDEFVCEVEIGLEDRAKTLVKKAIASVNQELSLRRDLDCGIQFGNRYSEIH